MDGHIDELLAEAGIGDMSGSENSLDSTFEDGENIEMR